MSLSSEVVGVILDRLPSAYAAVLFLEAAGFERSEIADIIGVPSESVPALAELAQRKLKALKTSAIPGSRDSSS